jgi:hypothetical protein
MCINLIFQLKYEERRKLMFVTIAGVFRFFPLDSCFTCELVTSRYWRTSLFKTEYFKII